MMSWSAADGAASPKPNSRGMSTPTASLGPNVLHLHPLRYLSRPASRRNPDGPAPRPTLIKPKVANPVAFLPWTALCSLDVVSERLQHLVHVVLDPSCIRRAPGFQPAPRGADPIVSPSG
jgi:hypothetical protein